MTSQPSQFKSVTGITTWVGVGCAVGGDIIGVFVGRGKAVTASGGVTGGVFVGSGDKGAVGGDVKGGVSVGGGEKQARVRMATRKKVRGTFKVMAAPCCKDVGSLLESAGFLMERGRGHGLSHTPCGAFQIGLQETEGL